MQGLITLYIAGIVHTYLFSKTYDEFGEPKHLLVWPVIPLTGLLKKLSEQS